MLKNERTRQTLTIKELMVHVSSHALAELDSNLQPFLLWDVYDW